MLAIYIFICCIVGILPIIYNEKWVAFFSWQWWAIVIPSDILLYFVYTLVCGVN